jgi:hypothetical protein
MTAGEATTVERTEQELPWAGLAGRRRSGSRSWRPSGWRRRSLPSPADPARGRGRTGGGVAAVAALVVSVVAAPVLIVRHFHRHRAARAHLQIRDLAERGRSRTVTATCRCERVPARALAKLGGHGR